MNLPADRTQLVALCAFACDAAKAATPEPRPVAELVPAAGLARLHCMTLAGAMADPKLSQVAHLALACAEYLENVLAVRAEQLRAAKEAAAAAMQGAA